MSNKIGQLISEMIDGEIKSQNRDMLIQCLKREGKEKCKWERYHLIGDAIRNSLPDHIDNQLASRVRAALESEPSILAPKSDRLDLDRATPGIVSLPPVMPHVRRTTFRPVVGLATAAMVGAVSWFGLQAIDRPGAAPSSLPELASNSQAPVAIPSLASAVAVAPPAKAAVAQSEPVLPSLASDDRWKRLEPFKQHHALGPYLIEHSEVVAASGVQHGVMPFARVVNFGADGNP